jgi:predicted AAA+ superfamily ATPase
VGDNEEEADNNCYAQATAGDGADDSMSVNDRFGLSMTNPKRCR